MKKKNNMKFFITLILFTGFLGTSIISYVVSRTSIRKQISDKQLPLISDNIYSEVQNDILKPIFISSLMASDTFLRDWLISGEKDVTKIKKYLSEIKLQYKVFSSFLVSENTKNYYYPDGILKNVSTDNQADSWYFRIQNMPNNHEINVDTDMANNFSLTIFINYKVFDYKGKYLGATGVGLQVDKLNTIIADYQKRYNCQIHFIDNEGYIKLSSSMPFNSKYHFNLDKYRTNDSDSYNISTFNYKKNGENILVNVRYIPEFKWSLLIEQSDEKEVKVLLNTLMFNSIITFFISVIIIIIIHKRWKKYHNELENLALTDKLTKIFNRQAFEIHIDSLIKEVENNNTFSMLIFDIDNFKYVNDHFGHLVGDFVLKTVVELAQHSLEEKSNIFRWGGDEFIVLLNGNNLDEAFETAEKIRVNVNNEVELNSLNVSVSIGVVEYQKGENIDELIKRADELMYRSKTKGKNKTEK